MSPEETARILLSSEYARRRGYLSQILTSWNQLAVSGTLALWTLLVRWDLLLRATSPSDRALFATQVAWASATSSILLGMWRLNARIKDDAIIALYPIMYLCERILVPPQACTLPKPVGVPALGQKEAAGLVAWQPQLNSVFGGRWHHQVDWATAVTTIALGAISVLTAVRLGVATTTIGWLLSGNAIGLAFILGGWLWWTRQEHNWPVPPDPELTSQETSGLTTSP